MDCKRVRNETIAEKYVSGRLSEDERSEYERHYFGCDECFAALSTVLAIKAALPIAVAPRLTIVPRQPRMRYWLIPLAAALILIFFLPKLGRQPATLAPVARTSPAKDYTQLARFDPPSWNAVLLRGPEKPDRLLLEKARGAYTARDYAGCAAALAPLSTPEALYYRGICQLLSDNTPAAVLSLQTTISSGDTPYLEEARFYLAKAFLRSKDPAAARDQLQRAIALHGDIEQQANRLLQQLN